MGQQSGAKGQQPPNMQGGYGQAMNMQQGWGGGWQVPYMNNSPASVAGTATGNAGTGGPPQPGQAGYQQPPADYANPGTANHMGAFQALMKQDPRLAYDYTYGQGAQPWFQQNQGVIKDTMFGGDANAMNSWINNSAYGQKVTPEERAAMQQTTQRFMGGNAQPQGQAPIDFAAGFDPSKSIWGEAGRKAYMSDKANEFFRNEASGSALFDQWKQIHDQNPLAARAFRQAVQGRGAGQNDFEQQLLQRQFGGDTAKWNEYRNAAHGANQEGLESGFDLTTGKWDVQRPDHPAFQVQGWNPAAMARQGAAPNGPWDPYAQQGSANNPNVVPSGVTGVASPIGATPVGAQNVAAIPQGNLPWMKNTQPPAMAAQRDSRWRGLGAGGKPAFRQTPEQIAAMNTPVTN
jgi:hypothetical protein